MNVKKGAALLLCTLAVSLCTPAMAETYTGSAQGNGGDVTVEVTVENNAIAAVHVTEQSETPAIAASALEQIPASIVANQTVKVDSITGATITSQAIIEATAEALENAGLLEHFQAETVKPDADVSLVPGTYTGSARGMYSDIAVSVTLDETSITDVTVTQQNDSYHLAKTAVNVVPAAIVEEQTVNVDVASGATMTSTGIINAVRAALRDAGALDAFNTKPAKLQKVEGDEEKVDIVVVGGGGAGLSAAAYARKAGAESVLVLEKLSYTGGGTSLSSSGLAVIGSRYNADAGMDMTPEEWLQSYIDKMSGLKNRPDDVWFNEDLVYKIGSMCGNTFDDMMDAGMPMEERFWEPYTSIMGYAVFARMDEHPKAAGILWSEWLTSFARDCGAEVRLNSAVTDLLVEDGAVGAFAWNPQRKPTMSARTRSFWQWAALNPTENWSMSSARRFAASVQSPAPVIPVTGSPGWTA